MAALWMCELAPTEVSSSDALPSNRSRSQQASIDDRVTTVGHDWVDRRVLRVLVVNDEQETGDVLVSQVRRWGHAAHLAYDGRAALRVAAVQHPDVVLLDLEMPLMDGCQVARQLRARFRLENASSSRLRGGLTTRPPRMYRGRHRPGTHQARRPVGRGNAAVAGMRTRESIDGRQLRWPDESTLVPAAQAMWLGLLERMTPFGTVSLGDCYGNLVMDRVWARCRSTCEMDHARKVFGGIILTIVLGVVGAVVGGYIGTVLGYGTVTGFDIRSLLIAIGGAMLLLIGYRLAAPRVAA